MKKKLEKKTISCRTCDFKMKIVIGRKKKCPKCGGINYL